MDLYWESLSTYSTSTNDYPYLPCCEEPVWILGSLHNSIRDRDAIADDIRSRLWFTYRKGFSPIGSPTGPTSDAGWGCMHRCGQMMLAEALIKIHLGRSWRWNPDRVDPPYLKILRMFEDRASALYSIHSITVMGVSEDKALGSWLGPNTISQVLKKLSTFDKWTNLVVHVTTEDGVIIDEIKKLCRSPTSRTHGRRKPAQQKQTRSSISEQERITESDLESNNTKSSLSRSNYSTSFLVMKPPSSDFADCSPTDPEPMQPTRNLVNLPISKDVDSDFIEIIIPPVVSLEFVSDESVSSSPSARNYSSNAPARRSPYSCANTTLQVETNPIYPSNKQLSLNLPSCFEYPRCCAFPAGSCSSLECHSVWRPLLLIVPLRLGLNDFNTYYIDAIKGLYEIPQCIGILGGRTNHALWLIGYVGNQLLCLDPHTTQQAVSLGMPTPGLQSSDTALDLPSLDGSFHCNTPLCLPFSKLDPSLAVGFVCRSEADFNLLCSTLSRGVLSGSSSKSCPTIFEIHEQRPNNLPPPFFSNVQSPHTWSELLACGDPKDESSDEFEIL